MAVHTSLPKVRFLEHVEEVINDFVNEIIELDNLTRVFFAEKVLEQNFWSVESIKISLSSTFFLLTYPTTNKVNLLFL